MKFSSCQQLPSSASSHYKLPMLLGTWLCLNLLVVYYSTSYSSNIHKTNKKVERHIYCIEIITPFTIYHTTVFTEKKIDFHLQTTLYVHSQNYMNEISALPCEWTSPQYFFYHIMKTLRTDVHYMVYLAIMADLVNNFTTTLSILHTIPRSSLMHPIIQTPRRA